MILQSIKNLIDRQSDEIVQFGGYVAVSAGALCVDFFVFGMLLATAKFAFVAAMGGYLCGVASHYFMSSRIVFSSRFNRRGIVEEAPTIAKFFAAGASGLVVTAATVGLLADVAGIHPMTAKVVASGLSFVVVFLSLRLFVFNHPAPDPSPAV